ncbi:hypothetical protein GEMRC1_003406 [Eukaryota sp. GEM-RC1]
MENFEKIQANSLEMYSVTELSYAYDILSSLNVSTSLQAIRVRHLHHIIRRSCLDLSNHHIYDTLHSLFDVKCGTATFTGLVLLLRGIFLLQSDPTLNFSTSNLHSLEFITPAVLSNFPVSPFDPHSLPSPAEPHPTPELFLSALQLLQTPAPRFLAKDVVLRALSGLTRTVNPDVFQILSYNFLGSDYVSLGNFISFYCILYKLHVKEITSIDSIHPCFFYLPSSKPITAQPVAIGSANQKPDMTHPERSSGINIILDSSADEGVHDNDDSSSDESVKTEISQVSLGHDRTLVGNDGRFVSCLCPNYCTPRRVTLMLKEHDYEYYDNSIKVTNPKPNVRTKVLFVTFTTPAEAQRFIQHKLSLGTFVLETKTSEICTCLRV